MQSTVLLKKSILKPSGEISKDKINLVAGAITQPFAEMVWVTTGGDNKLFIAKPDGSPQRRDRMSANFGQLIRHLEMPHIRFHDLRHTAATNMHQLTGDFYTVGEILGHTLKSIGISLGISTNLEAVTAQYVDVRLERKQSVLQTYHKALQPKTTVTGKEAGQETSKKAKKKSSEMEL